MREINRIIKAILNVSSTKRTIDLVVKEIKNLGFDRVRLFLYEKRNNINQVVAKAQIGLRNKRNIQKFRTLSWPMRQDYAAKKIMRERSSIILKRERGPRYLFLEKQGLREYAIIPILIDKIVIGHISVDNKYSKRSLKLMSKNLTLASRFASLAFERNRKYLFDRKRVKEHAKQIRRQRDRYESLITHMNSFFIAVEENNFKIVQFNRTAEILFNIDKKSVIGKKVMTLFDKRARPRVKDILKKTLVAERITRGEFKSTIGHRECVIGYNTRRVPDIWHKGKYIITIIGADITEYNKLKKELANERDILKSLVDDIDDGLAIIDNKYTVTWANRIYASKFGFTPKAPSFCYEAYNQKAPCPDCPSDYVFKVKKTGYLSLYDSNKKRYYELILKPIGADKSTSGELLEIVQDVTEHKGLIDDLEKVNRRLRKLDRNKSEFIAAVSHELRNPLTSIKSFAEILMSYQDEEKPRQQEFLKIINEESDRLGRMIVDLLSLSRTDVTKRRWRWKKLVISELIQKAVRELSQQIKGKEIDLKIEVPPNFPVVKGDEDRLIEVLSNLLDNAVKFTPQKGNIIIGGCKMKDKILIFVSDSGPGIPAEYIKKIFVPFFRVDSNDKGTGLGLSICRKILDRHKGNIWAESKHGHGATFKFHLPVKES